jgi:hypothetical protein
VGVSVAIVMALCVWAGGRQDARARGLWYTHTQDPLKVVNAGVCNATSIARSHMQVFWWPCGS